MDRRTPVKYLALIFLAIYNLRMNVTWVLPTCTKGGTVLLKDQLTSLKSFACRIFTPSNARFKESKLRRKLLVGKIFMDNCFSHHMHCFNHQVNILMNT